MKKTGGKKKGKRFSENNFHCITPITIQMSQVRSKVIQLYKQLQYLGREYPAGAAKFRQQCHEAFMKNKDIEDPKQIMALVAKGRYVVKELEALYSLKKYRAMKQRYEKN